MGEMPSSTAWVAGVSLWQWLKPTPSPPKSGATGGSQVKTITIRLAAPEAAMLVEIQKRNKDYRDIQSFFLCQIREEYRKELGLA